LLSYALQRLALSVPAALGLTALIFFLLHAVTPTDTVDILVSYHGANDPDLAAQLREEFGLSDSLPRQYLRWTGDLAQGDLGTSLVSRKPVGDELAERLPVSVQLGAGALLLTVLVAVPVGMVSAAMQDSPVDQVLRGGSILNLSLPDFWAATLVLVFGSVWFNWAPPLEYAHFWERPLANVQILAVPVALMALAPIGSMVRLVRTQMLEVTRQDYVRTARAKGLRSRDVYLRHVLRNSMLPVVTFIGLQLPRLVAGTVIFEQIFGLPGVGRYLLEAIGRLDYPVILATNLVFGLLLILANLIVDLSYAWIDPRIRLR
jgi:peptide/nickel transport system permease protein